MEGLTNQKSEMHGCSELRKPEANIQQEWFHFRDKMRVLWKNCRYRSGDKIN